jgi:hypothetical protein
LEVERRATATLKRKMAQEENISKLQIFFTQQLSMKEKEALVQTFTQKYMWKYELWRDYLIDCIKKNDLDTVLLYLENVTPLFSPKTMYFMKELLDTMRDYGRDYIFWPRPHWEKLQFSSTKWWQDHIIDSLNKPDYIHKLTKSSWMFITPYVLKHNYKMDRRTAMNIIDDIYTKDSLAPYRFDGGEVSQDILMTLQSKSLTVDEKTNVRFYLTYLIQKRAKSVPPLTVDITQVTHNYVTYYFDSVFKFITMLVDMDEKGIATTFTDAFDIKRQENAAWLKFLLECIVRQKFMASMRSIDTTFSREDTKKVVSFLITSYKININNVYMTMNDLFAGEQPIDPIRNPKIWLNKNTPVIAWAILYENMDAIDFLLKHGAKLDRCAIAMQDLTNNPRILGAFLREQKATKIQRAYSKYHYNPSHKSQIERAKTFKERYQSRASTDATSV